MQPIATVPLIDAFSTAKTAGGMVSPASSTVDPNFFMERYVLPEARFNPGGELPADMVQLAQQASAPWDAKDRAPTYAKFAEKWMDNAPNVRPVCLMHSMQAFSPTVSGVSIYETGVYDVRGVAVKKGLATPTKEVSDAANYRPEQAAQRDSHRTRQVGSTGDVARRRVQR